MTIDAFASTHVTNSSRTFRCVSSSTTVASMALQEVRCDLQGASAPPSCSRFVQHDDDGRSVIGSSAWLSGGV